MDAIRGVASLIVLAYHATDHTLVLSGAYLAVDLFFALSGFVLAHAYEPKLRDGFPALRFLKLRFVRLLPLYFCAMVIASILVSMSFAFGGAQVSLLQLLGTIALGFVLLPAPPGLWLAAAPLYPLNAPAWSLLCELVANALYALFARHLTSLRLVVVTATIGAALVLCAYKNGGLDGGSIWQTLPIGFLRVAFSFLAGVGLYRLQDVLGWRLAIPVIVPSVLVVLLLALPAWPLGRGLRDSAIVVIAFPLILLVAARARPTGLARTICAILGRASYGVYVLHVPLLSVANAACPRILGVAFEALGMSGTLIFAACVFTTALILDAAYDRPVRAFWRARIEGERAIIAAESA